MADFHQDLAAFAGGRLTVDLGAIRANYETVAKLVFPARTAAVVKADAYGLGVAPVARALLAAGCLDFFVAHLAEAWELAPTLPAAAKLYVLNGLQPGAESVCADLGAIPVLNAPEQVTRWREEAAARGRALPAVLQVDTGMSRLGLPPEDFARLATAADLLAGIDVVMVMSHLACADVAGAPANAEQLARFERLAALMPDTPRSIANSGGVFAGPGFYGDMVRPGLALYGAGPFEGEVSPMRPVVMLEARVIQIRQIEPGTGVGYGLTFTAERPMRIATVAVGYADGWPRSLGGRGAAYFAGVRLPIVGRVSMDSMTIDVSGLPDGALQAGDGVELIGPHQTLEAVAASAGAIPYEILTGLGRRYARRYVANGLGALSA